MTTSATPSPVPEPAGADRPGQEGMFGSRFDKARPLPCSAPSAARPPRRRRTDDSEYARASDETTGTAATVAAGARERPESVRRADCREMPMPFLPDRFTTVRVDDPGELIAAIPAMLGFTPERSVVVLVLGGGDGDGTLIDAVLRFDLEQDGGRRVRPATLVAGVARICARDKKTEVLAVLVDDRAEPPPEERAASARCGAGRFDVLVGALGRRLALCDITLRGVWAVPAIAPGSPWWALFGPEDRGLLRDPATSLVTLTHVLDGRPIRRTRSDLTAVVAVDPVAHAEVAAELEDALSLARERYARAARRGDPYGYSRQALDYVLWQIANTASGVALLAPELAKVVAALRDRPVRDTMFALAVGDHAAAAEAMWAALTRASSDTDRAEAAALLGYSAYVRGDGPLAGVALEAALAAAPDHPIATLLDAALRLGMRPEHLRRLARSGYHTAAGLGVDLGEPTS